MLGDHVFAVDVNSRIVQWSWPENANAAANRLTGQIWVQEHEIKPGQLLVFAATFKAGLVVLEVDPSGRAKPYPRLEGSADITGAPFVDHLAGGALLYVPAGNNLMVFDISSITEVSAPRRLYSVTTQGDIIGRPVKSVVAGRPAILLSDMTGLIMAIDADPRVPDTKRILGSWPINGTQPTTPVCKNEKSVAYVSVAEGRVMALDLSHPGQLLWRFPLQGALGAIAGSPAIGSNGVYVADANGVLRCLDPQTGSERWKADLGSPAVGGPIAKDGRVFVPLKTGHLVCFEEGDE
ncbi:MAG: PQQ-binding-like beta-propeller repeat protein [Planctomycetes bacterium]|nr:PQQ-binding-like beta-propeller repeat protein [Planctomycetota bacterium]